MNTEVPPFFDVKTVTKAFGGVLKRRSIRKRLRAIGALDEAGKDKLVDTARLHEHWPSVYHRCVQIWMSEQGKDGE